MTDEEHRDTSRGLYTDRLLREEGAAWKRWLNAQAPYRWNLRRLHPGFALDIGCGLGRNLLHLDGSGVGVDHNPDSVRVCRDRGLEAYTQDDLWRAHAERPFSFDSLILSHVVEHMTQGEARQLIADYLPLLRPGGKVILIAPQEYGYRADPTHVEFFDLDKLRSLASALDLVVERSYSFPLPHRPFGRVFRYNEFVTVATR